MRELRDYQKEMVDYCLRSSSPILWVEMRLGKTLVVIRCLQELQAKRVLVVAPNSALRSWETELALEGETDVTLLQGTKATRQKRFHNRGRWCLINKEGFRSIPEIGKAFWDAVVLDESASAIRYPRTQITKFFLSNFQRVPKKFCLAGRPDPQNRLLDYWPQMAWAMGGYWMGCYNYWQFRHRYFHEYGYDWVPRPGAKAKILEQVSKDAFVLRREMVDLDVPKIYQRRVLQLPSKLQAVYKKAEDNFILETPDQQQIWTKYKLVQYQWLRQLAGGFIDGGIVWDGKLKELRNLVEGELSGEKVVVWMAYTQEIKAAYETLPEGSALWITGQLPTEERKRRFRRFETGAERVLLCQVKIGETGEDLAAANTAIYYSLPFGVLSWVQSQDRILGDLTKSGVYLLSLITEDTLDEDVYATLQQKDLKGQLFLNRVHEKMLERRGDEGEGREKKRARGAARTG